MTRDEIMNMPAGREMDALVAEKVMRWGVIRNDLYVYIPRPNEAPYERLDELKWLPSNDIAAAWQVVEKGARTALEQVNNDDGEIRWDCDYASQTSRTYSASAPTAPLAICRAALLAVADATDAPHFLSTAHYAATRLGTDAKQAETAKRLEDLQSDRSIDA